MVISKNKTMSKKCVSCGDDIHPKRLEILPKTKTCVSCSTTGRKRGVSMQFGEGDHSYNETIIMEEEDYLKYLEAEARMKKIAFNPQDEISEIGAETDDFASEGDFDIPDTTELE